MLQCRLQRNWILIFGGSIFAITFYLNLKFDSHTKATSAVAVSDSEIKANANRSPRKRLKESEARSTVSRSNALSEPKFGINRTENKKNVNTSKTALTAGDRAGSENNTRGSFAVPETRLSPGKERLLMRTSTYDCPVQYFTEHRIWPQQAATLPTERITPPWRSTRQKEERRLCLDKTMDLPIPKTFDARFMNPCWVPEGQGRESSRLKCLPYYFLAGFPKCGTTDLHYKIGLHPQIQMSKGKEPQWWRNRYQAASAHCHRNGSVISTAGPSSFDKYTDVFSKASACMEMLSHTNHSLPLQVITGDGSTSTAWDNAGWKRLPGNDGADEPRFLATHHIRYFLPNAKILIIMRNPVDRLFSSFLYFWEKEYNATLIEEVFHSQMKREFDIYKACFNREKLRSCLYRRPSHTTLHIQVGVYSVFIKDWLEVFPRHQLHFLRLEDFKRQPVDELNRIYKFLGVGPLPDNLRHLASSLKKKNTRKSGDIPLRMLPETRVMAEEFYRPFNEELANILEDKKYLWKDDVTQ